MNDEDIVRTDIGLADQLTMDELVRTMIAQMFENDNNVATLEVVLNDTGDKEPPKLEIECTLKAINGVATRTNEDGE